MVGLIRRSCFGDESYLEVSLQVELKMNLRFGRHEVDEMKHIFTQGDSCVEVKGNHS
jgi:hypothetical protein